mgnify:CR=1 FL=1
MTTPLTTSKERGLIEKIGVLQHQILEYNEMLDSDPGVAEARLNYKDSEKSRKAILKGLTPHENRTIPPLNYERVKFIQKSFKNIDIILNGGITDIYEAKSLLKTYNGVMIGRYAWDNPWGFKDVDHLFCNQDYKSISRSEIIQKYVNYSLKYLNKGHSLRRLVKPLFNIFYASPGSKYWKQQLNEISNNNLPYKELTNIVQNTEKLYQTAA